MISSYGENNLTIIGEGTDSIIDGQNCYDPDGEEGYRGPHGIYFTNCDNVTLRNYTCQHSGNFMHQLDKCNHVRMEQVDCYGGSDGIHLHHTAHCQSICKAKQGKDRGNNPTKPTKVEPIEAGADVMVGSLIKNAGGGIAPTGAYIAGRADLIERISYKMTAPGIGAEVGSYAASYLPFFQGIFLAPQTVAQALKGAIFSAKIL